MQTITLVTWPRERQSLVLGALEAALGRPVVRRGPDAGRVLVEYEDFPTGVIARYEAALAKGEAEDTAQGFGRFASTDFAIFRAFRNRWIAPAEAAEDTPRLVVPRTAFRANPGAFLPGLLDFLAPEIQALSDGAALDHLAAAMAAWIAAQPAPDVTAFRHHVADLFERLGRLALPRDAVQETFREVMGRDIEEKSILAFQGTASRQRLREILKGSQEYRARFGGAAASGPGPAQTPAQAPAQTPGQAAARVPADDLPAAQDDLPPVLIHLHIPKSAGTSLTAILASNFGPGEKLALDPTQLGTLDAMPPKAMARLRLVFGHLPHGVGRHLRGRQPMYVCALREAGPRLLSYYRYMKRREDHPMYRLMNDRDMSFGEFLEHCVTGDPGQRPEADNGQMRRLAGHLGVPGIGREPELFRSALRNLMAPDMVFGLTERFGALLEDLVRRGLITDYETVVANAAPESASFEEARASLTARQQEILESFTCWDRALYDVCKTYLFGLDAPA